MNKSTNMQKSYLRRHVDSLSKNDVQNVGRVLIDNGRKNALEFCSIGTAINLDSLPDNIVEQMYDIVVERINAIERKIDT